MSETKVLSLHLTDKAIHSVFYFPGDGHKPKELPVLGVALTRITELVMLTPVVRHTVEPIFVLEDEVAIGSDYRADPHIIAVPAGRGARGRALKEYKRRTT